MTTEVFWFTDPSVLFSQSTWLKFVPTPTMSVPEALNAVVRFTAYLSLLLFVSAMRPVYLLAVPIVVAITVVLNRLFPTTKKMTEAFRSGSVVSGYVGEEKTQPTDDNPFMNPSLVDIHDVQVRPPADDAAKKEVRDKINTAFTKTSNIYMNTTDVFDMVQSQRNFYTVVEDDHGGFLKFLDKNPKSDKLLSEGYAAAKGTIPELPSSQSIGRPTGTSA